MALKSILKHKSTNLLECGVCKQCFSMTCKYIEHMSSHKHLLLSCNICNKPFYNQKDLDEHYVTHKEVVNTYNCNQCYRKFLQKYQLEQHMQFHSILSPAFGSSVKRKKSVHFTPDIEIKTANGNKPLNKTITNNKPLNKISNDNKLPNKTTNNCPSSSSDESESDDDEEEEKEDYFNEDFKFLSKTSTTRSGRTVKVKKFDDEPDIKRRRKDCDEMDGNHRHKSSHESDISHQYKNYDDVIIKHKNSNEVHTKHQYKNSDEVDVKRRRKNYKVSSKVSVNVGNKEKQRMEVNAVKTDKDVKVTSADNDVVNSPKVLINRKELRVTIEKIPEHVFKDYIKNTSISTDDISKIGESNNSSLKNSQAISTNSNSVAKIADAACENAQKNQIGNKSVNEAVVTKKSSFSAKQAQKCLSSRKRNTATKRTSSKPSNSPESLNSLSNIEKQFLYVGPKQDFRRIRTVMRSISSSTINSESNLSEGSLNANSAKNTSDADKMLEADRNTDYKDLCKNNEKLENKTMKELNKLEAEGGILEKKLVNDFLLVKVTPELMKKMKDQQINFGSVNSSTVIKSDILPQSESNCNKNVDKVSHVDKLNSSKTSSANSDLNADSNKISPAVSPSVHISSDLNEATDKVSLNTKAISVNSLPVKSGMNEEPSKISTSKLLSTSSAMKPKPNNDLNSITSPLQIISLESSNVNCDLNKNCCKVPPSSKSISVSSLPLKPILSNVSTVVSPSTKLISLNNSPVTSNLNIDSSKNSSVTKPISVCSSPVKPILSNNSSITSVMNMISLNNTPVKSNVNKDLDKNTPVTKSISVSSSLVKPVLSNAPSIVSPAVNMISLNNAPVQSYVNKDSSKDSSVKKSVSVSISSVKPIINNGSNMVSSAMNLISLNKSPVKCHMNKDSCVTISVSSSQAKPNLINVSSIVSTATNSVSLNNSPVKSCVNKDSGKDSCVTKLVSVSSSHVKPILSDSANIVSSAMDLISVNNSVRSDLNKDSSKISPIEKSISISSFALKPILNNDSNAVSQTPKYISGNSSAKSVIDDVSRVPPVKNFISLKKLPVQSDLNNDCSKVSQAPKLVSVNSSLVKSDESDDCIIVSSTKVLTVNSSPVKSDLNKDSGKVTFVTKMVTRNSSMKSDSNKDLGKVTSFTKVKSVNSSSLKSDLNKDSNKVTPITKVISVTSSPVKSARSKDSNRISSNPKCISVNCPLESVSNKDSGIVTKLISLNSPPVKSALSKDASKVSSDAQCISANYSGKSISNKESVNISPATKLIPMFSPVKSESDKNLNEILPGTGEQTKNISFTRSTINKGTTKASPIKTCPQNNNIINIDISHADQISDLLLKTSKNMSDKLKKTDVNVHPNDKNVLCDEQKKQADSTTVKLINSLKKNEKLLQRFKAKMDEKERKKREKYEYKKRLRYIERLLKRKDSDDVLDTEKKPKCEISVNSDIDAEISLISKVNEGDKNSEVLIHEESRNLSNRNKIAFERKTRKKTIADNPQSVPETNKNLRGMKNSEHTNLSNKNPPYNVKTRNSKSKMNQSEISVVDKCPKKQENSLLSSNNTISSSSDSVNSNVTKPHYRLREKKLKDNKATEEAIQAAYEISLKFEQTLSEKECLKLLNELDSLITNFNIRDKCPFLFTIIRFCKLYVDSYKVKQQAIALHEKIIA